MNKYLFSQDLLDLLLQRKNALKELHRNIISQADNEPDGWVRAVDKKSFYQYYWRKYSEDKNGVYISKQNMSVAKDLAQKEYRQKLLENITEEYDLLSHYSEHLERNSPEDIYSNLPKGKRIIVDPLVPDRDRFVSDWLDDAYEPMLFTEPTEFYTTKEIRVRSKSELVIANLLEQYEVPYKYEKPLYLRGLGQIRPDFTCLNTRTRKEYVWEHFGMMDNAIYASKNVEKIAVYQQNGFFAGKNMIATFESTLQPLSTKNIKTTIEEYLL